MITMQITTEEMKVLADLTLDLTRLKLKEVPHLCIENYAPEMFEKLIAARSVSLAELNIRKRQACEVPIPLVGNK